MSLRTVSPIGSPENAQLGIEAQAKQSAWHDGNKDRADVNSSLFRRLGGHVPVETRRSVQSWLVQQALRGCVEGHGQSSVRKNAHNNAKRKENNARNGRTKSRTGYLRDLPHHVKSCMYMRPRRAWSTGPHAGLWVGSQQQPKQHSESSCGGCKM